MDRPTAVKQLASRCQHHAACFAFKQCHAELALQCADAAGQGRLGEVKMACGRAKAAAFNDCDHVAHLCQFHGVSVRGVKVYP